MPVGTLIVLYFVGPALGPVSQPALHYSLARTVNGLTSSMPDANCRRIGKGISRCFVYDEGGSGGSTYRVTMRGYHCWHAKRIAQANPENPMPRIASGCVGVRDQVRFWARL